MRPNANAGMFIIPIGVVIPETVGMVARVLSMSWNSGASVTAALAAVVARLTFSLRDNRQALTPSVSARQYGVCGFVPRGCQGYCVSGVL